MGPVPALGCFASLALTHTGAPTHTGAALRPISPFTCCQGILAKNIVISRRDSIYFLVYVLEGQFIFLRRFVHSLIDSSRLT